MYTVLESAGVELLGIHGRDSCDPVVAWRIRRAFGRSWADLAHAHLPAPSD